jgi:chemotaxis protein methyltransferase CheR
MFFVQIGLFMNAIEIEAVEIELLLEAVNQCYGYDFRNYSKASLKRRIINFLPKNNCTRISDLIPLLLYDPNLFRTFVLSLSVTVTEMFRDPEVYIALRKLVVPFLKTFPFCKIWCAGCATGEEVYSLAILLKESGLLDKVQIYATDINAESLQKAELGIYSNSQIQEYTKNYHMAGFASDFSNHYYASYDSVVMDAALKKNIVFANHNLVSDQSFGDVQLIICRNTLIYFNRELQNRVLSLFSHSLVNKGFLCLGTKENLEFSSVSDRFLNIAKKEKLYQLR